MKYGKTLMMDLDGTLIYSVEEGETDRPRRDPDFEAAGHLVWKRPGLDELLGFASRKFNLGTWSQAEGFYVDEMVEHLFIGYNLKFAWCRDECSAPTNDATLKFFKDLKKLRNEFGIPEEKLAVLEDQTQHYADQPEDNLIIIPEYRGSEDDIELGRVRKFLECLADPLMKDVRRLIKYYSAFRKTTRPRGT